jgi:hypothetical protein
MAAECKMEVRSLEYIVRSTQTDRKIKAISLQTWIDPEGSRRLRFPDFKTFGP